MIIPFLLFGKNIVDSKKNKLKQINLKETITKKKTIVDNFLKYITSLCEGVTCSGHGTCEVNYGTMTASCVCDTGYEVLNNTRCIDSTICLNDSYCSNGKYCNDFFYEDTITEQLAETRCGIPTGNKNYGELCINDYDCKTNLCIQGFCSKVCNTTTDCLTNGDNDIFCKIEDFNIDKGVVMKYCYKSEDKTSSGYCDFDNGINICPQNYNCEINPLQIEVYTNDNDFEYLCVKSKNQRNINEPCKSDKDCSHEMCIYNGKKIENMCHYSNGIKTCLGTSNTCESNADCPQFGYCSVLDYNAECGTMNTCVHKICDIIDRKASCVNFCKYDSNCNFPSGQKQCVSDYDLINDSDPFNPLYYYIGICKDRR